MRPQPPTPPHTAPGRRPPQPRRPITREEYERRRAIAEQKRARARRRRTIHTILYAIIGVLLIAIVLLSVRSCVHTQRRQQDDESLRPVSTDSASDETQKQEAIVIPPETEPETEETQRETPVLLSPAASANTVILDDEIDSEYAVLIDLSSDTILAGKHADDRMYPASMTKVMTLLVAYEHIADLSETFTVTSTIIDPLYLEDASLAGFSPNEEVTVLDLMYGTILPSGAEAAVSLAIHVAGSEEEFVQLMNEKADELGLSGTHFTNCSGLHDADHYSTATEIAIILDYVLQYEECRTILSTYEYTTPPTNKHPEGVTMHSTMLSRMYGDEPDGVTILAGKTGYTPQAGQCLCSYAEDDETAQGYILVTGGATGKFEPVFDAITVYSDYTP